MSKIKNGVYFGKVISETQTEIRVKVNHGKYYQGKIIRIKL